MRSKCMEDLYYEILLAKGGDVIANENIIKRYNKYIKYMINKYEIAGHFLIRAMLSE